MDVKILHMGGLGQILLVDDQIQSFVFLDIQLDYSSQSLLEAGEVMCLCSCQENMTRSNVWQFQFWSIKTTHMQSSMLFALLQA